MGANTSAPFAERLRGAWSNGARKRIVAHHRGARVICGMMRCRGNCELYKSDHETVPNFVPSGGLYWLVAVATSEPGNPHKYWRISIRTNVAKLLNLRETNLRDQGVGGSNPLSPTNFFNNLDLSWEMVGATFGVTSGFLGTACCNRVRTTGEEKSRNANHA
jgi:hypothetical protein